MHEIFDDDLIGPQIPSDRPPTGSSQIINLIQDVWLRILPLCGIRGVLAIGQTCKPLRALACDKYVWLALIRDLEKRLFLDIPLGTQLHELSISTLVSLARRTVQGPHTWSPANGCPPTISRTYRVHHPRILYGEGYNTWLKEAKLLPGGRYILFNNWLNLECWNIAEDRLVWTHKSAWGPAGVGEFAAEIVDSGKAAVIVVCPRTIGLRKKFVEIIRLDFITETSRLLLLTYVPRTSYYDHPEICGDLVSVEINGTNGTWQTLLIKLSTAESMLLYPGPHKLAIIEGYLVILMADAGLGTVKLDVLAEEALQPFWQPVIQPVKSGQSGEEEEIEEEAGVWTWRMMSTEDVRGLVSWTIEIPAVVRQSLFAHKCPMGEGGEYVVWVYVSSHSTGNQSDARVRSAVHSSIYKFHLTLPSGRSGEAVFPLLRQVITTSADCDLDVYNEISYAGHTTMWDDDRGIEERLLALAEPQIRDREDTTVVPWTEEGHDPEEGQCGTYIHVSTYSGALTYSTYRELVVDYYE